jgi:hypothetical protein
MRRGEILVSMLVLLICSSCSGARSAAGGGEQRSGPTTQLAPAATQPTLDVRRLTLRRWLILSLQAEYLLKEGTAHRGEQFAKLAGAVNQSIVPTTELRDGSAPRRVPTEPWNETEVLALLGPPDWGDSDERGAEYFYFYDRFAAKDWYVSLEFDAQGC